MPGVDEDPERDVEERRWRRAAATRRQGWYIAVGGVIAAAMGGLLWAVGEGLGVGLLDGGVIGVVAGVVMVRFAA